MAVILALFNSFARSSQWTKIVLEMKIDNYVFAFAIDFLKLSSLILISLSATVLYAADSQLVLLKALNQELSAVLVHEHTI